VGDYFITLNVPANTPSDAPVTKTIEIKGEVLEEIAYYFPLGPSFMVSFAVYYGIKQIYPEPEGEWVAGDGMYRQVPVGWTLPESPCKLTVKAASPNTSYDHTIYIWLLTKLEVEARPWRIISDFVKILKRLMGLR